MHRWFRPDPEPSPADRLAAIVQRGRERIQEALDEAQAAAPRGLLPFDVNSRCPRCRALGDVEHHHLTGQRDDPVHGRVTVRGCRVCGHTWDEAG